MESVLSTQWLNFYQIIMGMPRVPTSKIEDELQRLVKNGLVESKVTKSGRRLWKCVDRNTTTTVPHLPSSLTWTAAARSNAKICASHRKSTPEERAAIFDSRVAELKILAKEKAWLSVESVQEYFSKKRSNRRSVIDTDNRVYALSLLANMETSGFLKKGESGDQWRIVQ